MMDSDQLPEDQEIIEKVEDVLQARYSSHKEFNDALDEDADLSFHGLKDPDHAYFVKPSEYLFWAERESYQDELVHWDGMHQLEQHLEAMEYIKESEQEGVFRDLVDALRLRRCAPFIGAGLSKPCGYPVWGEALRKIARRLAGQTAPEFEALLASYDYLKAAQVLHDASAELVHNFIKTEFRARAGNIIGPISLLPELSRGCIVTTNFDSLIEDMFKQQGQPLDGYMYGMQPGNAFVQRLLRGERCILKLHGDALQEKSHVFTQAQYHAAYGNPLSFQHQLPRALRQIFISHSFLFLGCSLEQDKTLDLFKSVVDEAAFEIPDHFALLNAPDTASDKTTKESRLLGLKIRPLWYVAPKDADGVPDHSLLEQLLKLAIAVSKNQVSLP